MFFFFENHKKYTFQKVKPEDLPREKTFYVYGDNLHESMEILEWFAEFNKDRLTFIGLKYISITKFVFVFKIHDEEYYFVASSYYHGGTLPLKVTKIITNLDKPDAVVYSVASDKVIMGFETTATTLAGNATWQRFGRTMQFMSDGIPFAYLAYSSKIDQSDPNSAKKPRTPSALFVLDFIALSMKYGTPALVGFFDHADPKQNEGIPNIGDFRKEIFEYLYDLLFDPEGVTSSLVAALGNMCNYYRYDGIVPKDEIDKRVRDTILSDEFVFDLTQHLIANTPMNKPLFDGLSISPYKWKPKKLTEAIEHMFPSVTFYQLSKNCKAGITFDTAALIWEINKHNHGINCVSYFKNVEQPTVVIPTKLTKTEKGKLVPTDDPYNGEISAFSELYRQSWPKANIMLLFVDHSNAGEYDVTTAMGRKIYKSISDYSDISVDMSIKVLKLAHLKPQIKEKKFENIHVTEDGVTCFFETVLLSESITPSFINPPCGSWSDMRLLPTADFYYYKRNDIRADVAFYHKGTYFIGESKENYRTLINDGLLNQYNKVVQVKNIIKSHLKISCNYRTFLLFCGTDSEAKLALHASSFDVCAILKEETNTIVLKVFYR